MLETHSVLYSSGGCSRPKLYISLQLGHPFNTSLKTFNETSTHGLGAFAITHLLHSAYLLRGEQSTFNQCFACVHSLAAASTNKSFPHNRCFNPGEGMWDVSGMLVPICVYGSCTFSNIEFHVYLSVVLHDFVNGSERALLLPPA